MCFTLARVPIVYDIHAYVQHPRVVAPRIFPDATSTSAAKRRRQRTTTTTTEEEEDDDDDEDVRVCVSRLARGRVDGVERDDGVEREARDAAMWADARDVSGARFVVVRGDETGERRWWG